MHKLAMNIGKMALVAKAFAVNPDATDGPQVHILARQEGFWQWLMSLLKIDTTTTFDVYPNRIEFSEGNMSGKLDMIFPVTGLSLIRSGYFKPVIWAILAILGVLLALPTIGISLILTAISLYFYNYRQTLLIGAHANNGDAAVLLLKRSLIEGVPVDAEAAKAVVKVVTQNMIAMGK